MVGAEATIPEMVDNHEVDIRVVMEVVRRSSAPKPVVALQERLLEVKLTMGYACGDDDQDDLGAVQQGRR